MKMNLLMKAAAVITLVLIFNIDSSGQEEIVPSERGAGQEKRTSKNCQLNSLAINPDSFQRGDSIDVKVVVVCNQPVEKATIWIRHLPEKRLPGATKVSRKILALKSGRNEVNIKRRAELGGKYRVTASVGDGGLFGILSTAPVAWTAHKVVFH